MKEKHGEKAGLFRRKKQEEQVTLDEMGLFMVNAPTREELRAKRMKTDESKMNPIMVSDADAEELRAKRMKTDESKMNPIMVQDADIEELRARRMKTDDEDVSVVMDSIKVKKATPEERMQRMGGYYPQIERLRRVLMFFMCLNLLGFPILFGDYYIPIIGDLVSTICGFVPLAFFILSGFLVLQEREDRSKRIVRAIKHSAMAFAVLAVSYFVINFFHYRYLGANIFEAFLSKRVWFNFVVLNAWPFQIGSAIWYVQALLYAYIILYFLDKWNLLRFDGVIAAVLLVLTVCTGELAGVLPWNIYGYTYIPGSFLTRALPYLLLGSVMYRRLPKLATKSRAWYYCGIAVGVGLVLGEIYLLQWLGKPGYYGHLLGMAVIAVSVCMLTLQKCFGKPGLEKQPPFARLKTNLIYYLCQPVSVLFALLLPLLGDNEMIARLIGFVSMATFLVCYVLAEIIVATIHVLTVKNPDEEEN